MFSSRLECEVSMRLLADWLVSFSDGVCAFLGSGPVMRQAQGCKNVSLVKCTRYSTSFAVFPLRSSSLLSVMRRAQGCNHAGCRRRQERRSLPSDSVNSKHFTNSHEALLYPNPLGVKVSEVFLHTIGVSESL